MLAIRSKASKALAFRRPPIVSWMAFWASARFFRAISRAFLRLASSILLFSARSASFDLPWIGEIATPFAAVQGLAVGAVLFLSAFLMFPVAGMFVNLFLDRIADAVEARHYPGLPPARHVGVIEALKGGLGFALVVLGVNLLALVFYMLSGPFAPLLFWAVNGYLLGREYFELVAQRRVEPAEMRKLRRRHVFGITLAGALMAVPLSIPVVNLIVPLLGVAAYTHMYHRLAGRAGKAA